MRRIVKCVGRGLLTLFYIVLALAVLAPIIYMLANAFLSTREALYRTTLDYLPFRLLPERVSLSQFAAALGDDPEFYVYFRNSVLLTLPAVGGTVIISALGGYALAKFRFPGKGILYFFAVFLVMLPTQLLLSPQYILARETGLLGTRAAVVLPQIFAPLGLFLMTLFLRAVPDDTLESARIEGAGEWRILLQIVLPLSMPIFATVGLYYLSDRWNEWYHPMIFINSTKKTVLQLVLRNIVNETKQAEDFVYEGMKELPFTSGVKMACVVMTMLPVMCVYPFLQRYFLKGMRVGAVKG